MFHFWRAVCVFWALFFFWQLESTWILFNKGKTDALTNEHAGFLMGQGLNGHITKLATLNVHNYLIRVCHIVHMLGRLLEVLFLS